MFDSATTDLPVVAFEQPTKTKKEKVKLLRMKDCTTPELRLEYLARWLERGGEARYNVAEFDMAVTIQPIEARQSCGAACCIMGAACLFWGPAGVDADNPLLYLGYESEDARNLLGLSHEQRNDLFYAGLNAEEGDEDYVSLEEITPAWAARCIRKFMAEGVVDWIGTQKA